MIRWIWLCGFTSGQLVLNGGLFGRAQNSVPVVIEKVAQTVAQSDGTQHQQIANLIFARAGSERRQPCR